MPYPPHSREAEAWFLSRGLPAVLRPGRLTRRLASRSAPALAGFAVFMASSVLTVWLTGKHTIDIDGHPSRTEWFVLAVVVLVLPAAAVVGWLVSRLGTAHRWMASAVSVAVTLFGGVFGGPSPRVGADLLLVCAVMAAIGVLTATGIGSVLGWATRMTLGHLAAVGVLFVRALPVLLLTVLVFFNTYVWLMAATVSRVRLWMALLFLCAIAVAFLLSGTLERVRPVLSATESPDPGHRLDGTPFEHMTDRPSNPPLSRAERVNVTLVVGLSQVGQVLTVALMTGVIFLLLGLILISPPLLSAWTRGNASPDGQFLGMTLPIPQALIHTTMFLSAMTFMYVSARAVGRGEYTADLLDPLVEDVRVTIAARNRYRTYTAAPLTKLTEVDNFTLVSADAAPTPAADVFGKRYGEVLLVQAGPSGPEATVYNTFPLNDCPDELWSKLDAQAIAEQNGALAALLNGPRYWLMSSIEKVAQGTPETKTFGGIEMIRQATVRLSSMNPAPYHVNHVDRSAAFTFDAGRPVFELVDPDGRRWVMQTWSQTVDKNLSLDDLAGLAGRLSLPPGWSYESRTLSSPLRVDTTTRTAQVTQDDLANSYSLQA